MNLHHIFRSTSQTLFSASHRYKHTLFEYSTLTFLMLIQALDIIFFWKPLGWKDLNNNGNPNWIKGGMHLHRKWTFIPPSIISSSYRYTLPSNKRHPTSKRKVTGPSVLHEKKKAIRWIEAELFFGLFVSSSFIMLLLLYAWGTCQRKSNSSKFGRDLAKINEGRTKKDSRYSRKCRIEWREVKMLLVTCSWSWRGKQMWAIITTCIATTDSLS